MSADRVERDRAAPRVRGTDRQPSSGRRSAERREVPRFPRREPMQASARIRFGVLGPLVVTAGRQQLPVGGPQQRTILGYLLIHANDVVPASRIVAALWPARPPATARKMLRNAVSNIRGLLAAHDETGSSALLTHSPGYLLRIDTAGLDLLQFEELARAGRVELADGAWREASRSLRCALGLWRGEPLADLRDSGIDWPELTTLREARLSTFEDYAEAELRVGGQAAILGELEQLSFEEPHRERVAGQLMLALYRSGRQADALEVYRRTRTALRDLGLEPTVRLRDLQREILDHDVSLQGSAPAVTVRAGGSRSERKFLSILTIALDVETGETDPAAVDELLADSCSAVREEIDAAGGTVMFYTGSIVLAVFGISETGADPVTAAVRTAAVLRDRFAMADGTVTPRLSIRSESIRLEHRGAGIDVCGVALEHCVRAARTVPPSEIWVCDATKRRGDLVVAETIWRGRPAVWWSRVEPHCFDNARLPFVDRADELAVLGQHSDQTIRRGRGAVGHRPG